MALDPDVVRSFNQTIYVAAYGGVSLTGDGTYGTPTPRAARVEPSTKLIDTTPMGEEIFSSQVILTASAIGLKDHIWMPGVDFNQASLARMPKAVDALPDEDGELSHYEVFV